MSELRLLYWRDQIKQLYQGQQPTTPVTRALAKLLHVRAPPPLYLHPLSPPCTSVRTHPAVHTSVHGWASAPVSHAPSENSLPACETLCLRDVQGKHTRVYLLSAFLRAKDPIDKPERSEFLQ